MISYNKQGVLQISGLYKSFGGVKVLNDVSFELIKGQIKGLIGPNGAGKTTLFNIITGLYRPDSGMVKMHYAGANYNLLEMKPYVIARQGIGRTFQKPSFAWKLSIYENVLLGAMNRVRKGVLKDRRKIHQWVVHCLETANIEKSFWHLEIGKVSILKIKQTELARALSLAPEAILCDEICSGLSPGETDELTNIIFAYSEKNRASILFVEHDLRAVRQICSDVVVLDFGRIIFDGAAVDAFSNKRVIEAYVGGGDA